MQNVKFCVLQEQIYTSEEQGPNNLSKAKLTTEEQGTKLTNQSIKDKTYLRGPRDQPINQQDD